MLLIKAFFLYYFSNYLKKIIDFKNNLLNDVNTIKSNKLLRMTDNDIFLQIEYKDYDIRIYKRCFFISFDKIFIDEKNKKLLILWD